MKKIDLTDKGRIISVLFKTTGLVEGLTLEEIVNRIMTVKKEFPEILPEIKNIHVKDGNLIFDVEGLIFGVDGQAVIEASKHRLPEA
ncbi:MAG: hypothetical protein A2174_00545 [Candidatus Portnoybacteria bacterium RBG_13_41_18]|uniref:Uncharacterized protein n=1 Tax=Candidatus Portnoybacteria bacterium RBG_13_41_18 TaxID=1801991 RepID=A0A1G2FBZ3_9BACT|nr:MAG: hypothetical protein A2174_00545 [Candidatus Portnoybacteria bacterium RBG_13_41_18]